MKTAISIPDDLFRAADKYAKSHGVSRSQLYAKALSLFLRQHPSDYITRQLDEVYTSEPSNLDDALSTMQYSSIVKEEW